MPEPVWIIVEHRTLASLPAAAQALLGADAFSTRAWFESTIEAALPHGAAPCFQVVMRGGQTCAILPMLREAGGLRALTTPYTCLWRPLLAAGCDAAEVGRALAPAWRAAGVVRLDCMPDTADGLARGLRQGGLSPLAFDHFGNWHTCIAGQRWADYVAARPGQLRSAITRQTRRLMQTQGAVFTLVQTADGLERAIADYEAVYAASWKEPEPSPLFNAALMRACAADGSLRLGLLHLAGRPIAAQFWLLHAATASVLKLAYDESYRKLAPGNVLTAQMIRHLIEADGAQALDFGRGDDDYKQLWTGSRRQRVGVLVANPRSASGLREVGKDWVKAFFFAKKSKKLSIVGPDTPARASAPTRKSFLVLFFKKERLPYLLCR